MAGTEPHLDIEAFWEYDDPLASEARFQAAMEHTEGDEKLELFTQVARTYGLRQEYVHAHAILDEIEGQLQGAGTRVHVRYLLERGRTCNSSGEVERARGLFLQGWEQAQAAEMEGQAVDAAHMIAITYAGSREAIEWNLRGLDIARGSKDAKARALIPAMLNNTAWDMHDAGRYMEALSLFEEALTEWSARAKSRQIQIAKWSVARCYRSLGRFEHALEIQYSLEREHRAAGSIDAYVFEEIAENLLSLEQPEEAYRYFRKAYDELSKDEWFVANESTRLKRLGSLGELA